MTPIARAAGSFALLAGWLAADAAPPRPVPPPTARIITFRGTITLADGARPMIGLRLREGDRISTGATSSVSLEMPDGSTVTLPSQSVLVVERLRRGPGGQGLDRVFRLETGRAAVEVTPDHRPGNRFEIRTPVSVAAVRGTVFRMGVPRQGEATTEVLRGEVGVSAGGAPVGLPTGFGTVASTAGAGEKTPLLPPPDIQGVVHLSQDGTMAFDLAPVAGAVRYHVQLARDDRFLQLLDETQGGTKLTLAPVPDGTYYVRVTAFDAKGLEGLPNIYPYDHTALALRAKRARP